MNANQIRVKRISAKLLHALTSHDKRQSKKPGYNRHALAHYCRALNEWEADPQTAENPLGTLPRHFCVHTNFQTGEHEFSIRALDTAVRKIKAELGTVPTVPPALTENEQREQRIAKAFGIRDEKLNP